MGDRYRTVPDAERFWVKVAVAGPEDCWVWLGAKSRARRGYGVFWSVEQATTRPGRRGKQVNAHRWSYEAAHGPIPDGLFIDHLCRNTHCVNPAHLEAVTVAENTRRWAATITHCPQGHAYDADNTFVSDSGKRHCRTCWRVRSKARDHNARVLTPEQRERKNAQERQRRAAVQGPAKLPKNSVCSAAIEHRCVPGTCRAAVRGEQS